MKCENQFCIYELEGNCTLDEISVDACGNCCECIHVNIDKELLKELKNEHLKLIEARYRYE
ncbi:MAG: hypothetical protein IKL44_02465 [Clostridia bacterium]|nr:hypothetical protein [Clostridia bacterium]